MNAAGQVYCDLCGDKSNQIDRSTCDDVVPSTWSEFKVPVMIPNTDNHFRYEDRHVCAQCVGLVAGGCKLRIH